MFGLSAIKLLFTLAAIVVVWHGFRLFQRREAARLARSRRRPVAVDRGPERPVEDTRRCPVCGSYVPTKGVTPCGRGDCPYPG